MSDSNSNRKDTARQANQEQFSHYELSRAYANTGFYKSSLKANDIAQKTASSIPPQSSKDAGIMAGQMAWAGRKDYTKSLYHAGMGFMEGVSRQNPNSGQQLNNMKVNQSIVQGRNQQNIVNHAKQERQNNVYSPKANQMNQPKANQPAVNKAIEAYRQKAAANPNTSKSTNKGIANYQNKVNGQSSSTSKSSVSGVSKGSGTNNSKGSSR